MEKEPKSSLQDEIRSVVDEGCLDPIWQDLDAKQRERIINGVTEERINQFIADQYARVETLDPRMRTTDPWSDVHPVDKRRWTIERILSELLDGTLKDKLKTESARQKEKSF